MFSTSQPLIAYIEDPTLFALQQGRLWPTLPDPRVSSGRESCCTVHPDNLQVTGNNEPNARTPFRLQPAPGGPRRGAFATWTGTGPSIAEATQMVRSILHDRESGVVSHLREADVTVRFTDLYAQPINNPANDTSPDHRELVVGELVTSQGNRLLSITVHQNRPILPFFVIISITNVHPSRTFSAFNCPSWNYPEDILARFTSLLRAQGVELVSLVPGVRTFSAVISTGRGSQENFVQRRPVLIDN
jgi:hypothetical protein